MAAGESDGDAERVVGWLAKEISEKDSSFRESGEVFLSDPPRSNKSLTVSISQIHASVFGGSRSKEFVEEIVRGLCDRNFLRPSTGEFRQGRGRKPSPKFEVKPRSV